mmetsp:Transcript_25553/g.34155  ORF Transcript_25553/g.34155 Transcript_25553/m.34155 type:complete len:222 (+) Transcript_25553:230-895(+)|eukprot:CAMPEP_0170457230 /NCGR_PEP_ID=MMETSP0123-20130129/4594_1 /TAXON_ID=182087 /ORGANISM="Favella ehrenbergii, Strain Fehren 1" /LENGTH=221 /DNA_ID=CAMNT_0010720959 /DNA_START=181 /DNA_END=846 /DNA_ORIENTATION=+
MSKVIPEIEAEMTFNHLPYGIRFFMFLNRIKFRLFFLGSLALLFNYWGNLLGIATSKVERVFKKYKKRWIYKYNRAAMTYPTALDTLYEPTKLSRQSTDKLSQLFLQIDREMEHGFSRQLVADCLMKMDLMDEKKEQTEFLDNSGHSYIRSKKLNSMSLREFLEVLDDKFMNVAAKDDPLKEFECVDRFLAVVKEEKETFLERCLMDIREAEMSPYEHKQR